MAWTLKRALRDWRSELEYAIKMKARGVKFVEASTAGPGLAKGRKEVSIDEYIAHWEKGIKELESGNVDPDHYNF